MASLTRRAFMIAGAAATGGLLIGIGTGPGRRWRRAVEATTANSSDVLVNLWLKVSPDNQVTVLVDKLEMGQGAHTGLAMMLADELGADWDNLTVEHVPARPEFATGQVIFTYLTGALGLKIPGMLEGVTRWALDSGARLLNLMFTGGSSSTMVGWSLHREAGAAARQMLIEAGAERLEADAVDCVTENSRVRHVPSGRTVTFGEIAAAAAERPAPDKPLLKSPEEFQLIGRPVPRLDVPAKTAGSADFGIDQRLPGMRYAALAVSPLPGFALESFAAGDVEQLPGVSAVTPIEDAVAVIADSWWAAREGAKQISARFDLGPVAGWSSAEHLEQLSRRLDEAELDLEEEEGDVEAALANHQRVEAEYRVPYLAHAAMEPMNCTVWFHDGLCEIWTGTQAPLMTRKAAADAAGLDPDDVIVHTTLAGGGFGRRFHADAVVRGVQVARTVDFPVQLLYSREDDMAAGFYRPAVVAKVSGAVDGQGQLAAWRYRYSGAGQDVNLRPYEVANYARAKLEVEEPIPIGPWRSVDHSQHAFFLESFADELAAAAGLDPFEFRRRHLAADSRKRRVLDELQTLADWKGRGGDGGGRGLALHESFGTVVGLVVDVSVQGDRLAVERVLCVADCGIAVNPNSVVAQLEGAIVYGLNAALSGEITSSEGAIEQLNFHNYPMLRLSNTPRIDVHLRNSGEFPYGIGEPGTPPAAPALANALFAATGERFRSLPVSQFRT